MWRPNLTFFCELEPSALTRLFAEPEVIPALQSMGSAVSLGLIDLSPERAGVVRRLNDAGIPLVAWLLLPRDQGYWFNVDNVDHAMARYADFRAWTAAHGLRWAGVGLDIERDIRDVQMLQRGHPQVLAKSLRGLLDTGRLRRAQVAYANLIDHIRADGYRVDSYQYPIIADERRAGSSVLQRLIGSVDLEVDREVLMLYSSHLWPHGPAMIWSYGREAQSVGVGSTGGGVDAGLVPGIGWEELARDLRLAAQLTGDIHVFSLEGCVRQGFLSRLADFNYSRPAPSLPSGLRRVMWMRRVLQASLWAATHPVRVVAALALFSLVAIMIGRRMRGRAV